MDKIHQTTIANVLRYPQINRVGSAIGVVRSQLDFDCVSGNMARKHERKKRAEKKYFFATTNCVMTIDSSVSAITGRFHRKPIGIWNRNLHPIVFMQWNLGMPKISKRNSWGGTLPVHCHPYSQLFLLQIKGWFE